MALQFFIKKYLKGDKIYFGVFALKENNLYGRGSSSYKDSKVILRRLKEQYESYRSDRDVLRDLTPAVFVSKQGFKWLGDSYIRTFL